MDCGALIFFGTLAALLLWAGLLIRKILHSSRRADELPRDLQALGARHGLVFSARGEDGEEPLVAGTTFVASFGEPRYRVSGALDGLQVDVLGVVWKRGFRTSQVRTQLAVVFTAPVARWPRFVLSDEWGGETPEELGVSDVKEVELPLGEDFEVYALWARSPEEVRSVFTPKLTAALVALTKVPGRPLVVEAFPTRLVLWREQPQWPSEAFEPLLADARQLRALLDEAVGGGPAGAGRCPRCGATLVPTNRFCGACGTAIALG